MTKSTFIGIAGLLVVAWGAYTYLTGSLGFFEKKSQLTQVQADYSNVGTTSEQPKPIPLGIGDSTTTSLKSNSSPAAASAKPLPAPTLPYKQPPFNSAAWIYDWGSASAGVRSLNFGAGTSTTGGDLFLANSNAWTNYTIQTNIDWIAGESFGIVTRLATEKNFAYCNFGDHTAQIVLRTDGTDAVLVEATTPNAGAGTDENLGMSVYGNDVACTVNGQEVLGTTLPVGSPVAGGVGFISWDPTVGVSSVALSSFAVTPLSMDDIVAPFPVPAPTATSSTTSATTTTSVALTVPTSTTPPPVIVPVKLELPYVESDFANDTNWQGTWGAMTIDSSGFMHIGSATDTSGGSAILNNTDNWSNYTFDATLDWTSGETFMMIAHYEDSDNYLACNFVRDPNSLGSVKIELEETVNGNQVTIQTAEDTNFSAEGNDNINLAFTIRGTQASCLFNGHAVTNEGGGLYGINAATGTIGFSTWDPTLGNSQIIVKKVSVTSN